MRKLKKKLLKSWDWRKRNREWRMYNKEKIMIIIELNNETGDECEGETDANILMSVYY